MSVGGVTELTEARSSRVQSVDRAVTLLRAVASATGPDATVLALAQACGLNRATAWRLLVTLEGQGMVVRNQANGRWSIGPGVVDIARAAGPDAIVQAAEPVVRRLSLQTGETVCLGVVDGLAVEYVVEALPPGADDESWVGRPVQLHASSMGKAFLAHLDEGALDEVLASGLERFTDTTVTDPDRLRAELAVVRRHGFAVCRGELEPGSWGVSAPILGPDGRPVAVLCLWGPEQRGGQARFEALGALTREAAQGLSRG